MSVEVSAVVCTRNRAPWLASALASLAAQTLPRDAREIVVVDNGSTDDTPGVIARAARDDASVRALVEPHAGLSRARNAGWRAARGRWVAFLDDDAIAVPDWLERIAAAFATREPRPGCVGGPITLAWPEARPAWLPASMDDCFTAVDLSPVPAVLDGGRWLAGCNMAFARDDLEALGGFDERLGRAGEALLSMEDVALQRRLARAGRPPFYDPAIAVRHHVVPERISQAWVERRVHWNGVSSARALRLEQATPLPRRLRLAAGTIGSLLVSPALLGAALARGADAERFARRCVVLGRLGYVRGLLR